MPESHRAGPALTALRRYLQRSAGCWAELRRPITIQMPVNLRKEGERTETGNKIGIIFQVELSPPTDDPYVRLRNIGAAPAQCVPAVDSVAPAPSSPTPSSPAWSRSRLPKRCKMRIRMPPRATPGLERARPRLPLPEGARMKEMHSISTLATQQPVQHHLVQLRR